jgi:hypothetical protein
MSMEEDIMNNKKVTYKIGMKKIFLPSTIRGNFYEDDMSQCPQIKIENQFTVPHILNIWKVISKN